MVSQSSGRESPQPAVLLLALVAVLVAGCGGGGAGSGQPESTASAAPSRAGAFDPPAAAEPSDIDTTGQIPTDDHASVDGTATDDASGPAGQWDENPFAGSSNGPGSSGQTGDDARTPAVVSATPSEISDGTRMDDGLGIATGASTETVGSTETSAHEITVSWVPPTLRVDGSLLDDLAGYRIYFGQGVDASSRVLQVDDPAATAWTVGDLGPGTWYVKMTAFDGSGRESDYSNTATATIP
jgi:hypothetical protein